MQQQTPRHRRSGGIFHIQELSNNVGRLLDPPDLLRCVQVCQLWNEALIPTLWHTIDDSVYCWDKYLERHDADDEKGNHDTDWVMAIFAKHGHHIRELRITWKVIISAAMTNGACTGLVSLTIHTLYNETQRDVKEKNGIPLGRSQETNTAPLLSSVFEGGVLKPMWSNGRSERMLVQDWNVIQQYWLLVRQNPGLRFLDLRRMPQGMGGLAKESFFYECVGMLDRLVDLTQDDFEVDLNRLLDCQPNLLRFGTQLNMHYRHMLERTFAGLRSISTKGTSLGWSLCASMPSSRRRPSAATISQRHADLKTFIETTPPAGSLQAFYLEKTHPAYDHLTLKTILPWLPGLTKLFIAGLTRDVSLVAIESCPQLEQVGESVNPSCIFPGHASQIQTNPNIPTLFLKSCPQLRVLDGIKLQINLAVDPLAAWGWTCSHLTTLRCQIIGLPQLTAEERLDLDTQRRSLESADEDHINNLNINQDNDNALLDEQMTRRDRIQTYKRLHHQVYDQLAELTGLRRLVIGFEFRDFFRVVQYAQDEGRSVWDYDDPVPGTLELSLASGLDRLSTLKNLEEFGFEGCDHRMGKREMGWVATNWPKLKIIRGMSQDTSSGSVYANQKKELREHLHSLRPHIIFM
ncbi:hypothetical protein BGX33_011173 [Mortierella sp. NVP41]|nr:hypothetical protein BGX33_011173 [Mortierella sp. NVP41]